MLCKLIAVVLVGEICSHNIVASKPVLSYIYFTSHKIVLQIRQHRNLKLYIECEISYLIYIGFLLVDFTIKYYINPLLPNGNISSRSAKILILI